MRRFLGRDPLRFLSLMLVLGFFLATGPAAAGCIDYEAYTHWLTGVEIQSVQKIIPFGDYAMLCNRDVGFQIVDLAEPLQPQLVSSLDYSGILDCEVTGTRGYAAVGPNGLTVISLANPALPWILGGVDTPGSAGDVAVSGSYAYVADTNFGLRAVDISDPSNPSLEEWDLVTPGLCLGVDVEGDYAFTAYGASDLQIADISDPGDPNFVASLSLDGDAQSIEVRDGTAYILSGPSWIFHIVDVTDPMNPTFINMVELDDIEDWAIDEDFLYLVHRNLPMTIVDISEPFSPEFVEAIGTPEGSSSIAVISDHILTSSNNLFSGVDLLNVLAIGTHDVVEVETTWESIVPTNDMVADSPFMYLGTGGFLEIYDVTTPSAPVRRSATVLQEVHSIAIDDDHVYCGIGSDRMQIVDVSDPDLPVLRGSIQTGLLMGGLTARDQYLYMGASGHLYAVDISDPDLPMIIGDVSIPIVGSITLAGNFAYLTDEDYGLRIVDISDPTAPIEVGSVPLPPTPYANGIAVEEGFAYVPTSSQELHVIDVSNPYDPHVVGAATLPAPGISVALGDGVAYVGSLSSGIVVFDLSDPIAPRSIGVLESRSSRSAIRVVADGDWLFVAFWHRDLGIGPLHCDAQSAVDDPTLVTIEGFGFDLFPNPARGDVRIDLSRSAVPVSNLAVFDAAGRRIRTLIGGDRSYLPQSIGWDSRDDHGTSVSPGVYWIRLVTGGETESLPVVVVR